MPSLEPPGENVAPNAAAIAMAPTRVSLQTAAGRLEEVLGKYAPSTSGVFLYFPDRKQVSPKLRVFIEHTRAFAASRDRAKDPRGRQKRKS